MGLGGRFKESEPPESPAPMKHAQDGPAEWMEIWRRRRPGLALLVALLVGGTAAGFLRYRGQRFFSEMGGVSSAQVGVVEDGGASEGQLEGANVVAELLRSEANDSSIEERRQVWTFLRECCGENTPGRSVDWVAVDEALTWLRGAVDAAPEIEAELMRLGGNRSLPETLRVFALQHLGMWAEGHPLGAETLAQLRAATGELAAGGAGGAALRILNRLRVLSEDEEWLRGRVCELLAAVDCSTEQRVAALQVAVELEAAEVEPLARKLAEPGRQVAERVNAFLALGRLGDHETLRWLGSQPPPRESLVLEAKQRALRCLAKRQRPDLGGGVHTVEGGIRGAVVP